MLHAPIALRPTERLAAILLLLETTPAPTLGLIALGVRAGGRAEARVIAKLPDGGREPLSADEARLLAQCLRADPSFAEALPMADDLSRAATEAEERAGVMALTRAEGRPAVGWLRYLRRR